MHFGFSRDSTLMKLKVTNNLGEFLYFAYCEVKKSTKMRGGNARDVQETRGRLICLQRISIVNQRNCFIYLK